MAGKWITVVAALACQAVLAQDQAAVIIGGYNQDGASAINTVELFGCSGSETVRLANLDVGIELADGVFYGDSVIVCGGTQVNVDEGEIVSQSKCFQLSSDAGENGIGVWDELAELPDGRARHKMVLIDDIETTGDNEEVPIVLGGLNGDEAPIIWKPASSRWEEYGETLEDENNRPENGFYGTSCFVEVNNGDIFHILNRVEYIDKVDWTIRIDLPEDDENMVDIAKRTGQCAAFMDGDDEAIMLRNGLKYNLEDKKFYRAMAPPHPGKVVDFSLYSANAMWTYNGKPTVFGNALTCNPDGFGCDFRNIVQYNVGSDSWSSIGTLKDSRTLHTVVTVPSSFCNGFVDNAGHSLEKSITLLLVSLAVLAGKNFF